MHSSHVIFYETKLKVIEQVIRKNLSLEILTMFPTDLIPLCCEYPMWLLMSGDQKIYLVFPTYHYAQRYIDMFLAAIENHRSVKISHYESIFIATL